MSMQDPIADMLTRIRNAADRRKPSLLVCSSKVNHYILKVLQDQGYIRSFQAADKNMTFVRLKYVGQEPAIRKIRRISRPGRRFYTKIKDLLASCGGMGTYVLSTPKGVMTDAQARKANVGGEVLCEVM